MAEQEQQSTLSKQERRERERERERQQQQRGARRKQYTLYAVVGVLLAGVIGGSLWFLARAGSPSSLATFDPKRVCINERIPLAMHIHPKLRIFIDGQEQRIPGNIGVIGSCVRPLHTHDGSGEIHVESNVSRDFTVSEFFAVWGKTFSGTQILDSKADDTHRIVMTAGGKESSEFEKLVLRDKEEVEIRYEKK